MANVTEIDGVTARNFPSSPAAALDYARPMASPRVRLVLPTPLSATLIICGTVIVLTPLVILGWSMTSQRDQYHLPDECIGILVGTGCAGLLVILLGLFKSPRVPQHSPL